MVTLSRKRMNECLTIYLRRGEKERSPVLCHQIQTGCLFHNMFIIIAFYITFVHSLCLFSFVWSEDENHYFDIFPLSS